MELEAAQNEVSLTFTTHSSSGTANDPSSSRCLCLKRSVQFCHLLMIFNNNLTLSPCVSLGDRRQPCRKPELMSQPFATEQCLLPPGEGGTGHGGEALLQALQKTLPQLLLSLSLPSPG